MAIQEVKLTITELINDLESGLTWFKSEDEGNGSIQEKYKANDREIAVIKQHPKLEGITPRLMRFIVIDDTKEENTDDRNGKVDTGKNGLVSNVGNDKYFSTSKESIPKGTDALGKRDEKMGNMGNQDALLEVNGSSDSTRTEESSLQLIEEIRTSNSSTTDEEKFNSI